MRFKRLLVETEYIDLLEIIVTLYLPTSVSVLR